MDGLVESLYRSSTMITLLVYDATEREREREAEAKVTAMDSPHGGHRTLGVPHQDYAPSQLIILSTNVE